MPSDTAAADNALATVDPAATLLDSAAAPAAGVVAEGSAAPADGSAEPEAGAATILDAPKEAAPAEPAAPVDPASYEIKLPDGMAREDPMISAFLESAAGARLDGAAVQAVLDKVAPMVAEQLAAPQRAWASLNTEWQEQVRADPEIGGANLSGVIERVNATIERFGNPALKEAMRLTGAANNPEILRYLNKLSAAYTEATPVVSPGSQGPVTLPPGRALAAMYPSATAPSGA
jgi:hypothetical protein